MINSFSTILIRSFRDFRRLGWHQGITALVMLLTLVPLLLIPHLYTVYTGMFVALVVGILLSWKFCVVQPRGGKTLRRLLATGLPIYIVGLVFVMLTGIDKVIVLGFLGTEQLGLYTLATTAMAVLMMVPSLISNVMYPRIAEHYGATMQISELFPVVRRVIRLSLMLTIPVGSIFLLTFYFYVIPVHMPAYLEGRNAMAIIMLAGLFMPVGAGFGDIFNVVGKQRLYLMNILSGLLVNACCGVLLISRFGMGLEGAAIATVVGLLVFAVLQVRGFVSITGDEGVAAG
jgi:O-antigen/teichoic acid export membrane protein